MATRRGWRRFAAMAALGLAIIGPSAGVALQVENREAASREAGAGRGSAVVWAVGDGANGGSEAKALAARIARGPIDRFLYLGDVYDDGTAEEFAESYAPVYG